MKHLTKEEIQMILLYLEAAYIVSHPEKLKKMFIIALVILILLEGIG